MSCDQAERGTIKLPTAQYSKFRKSVIQAYNEHQTLCLEAAQKLHAELARLSKGMRQPIAWNTVMETAKKQVKNSGGTSFGYGNYRNKYDGIDFYSLEDNVLKDKAVVRKGVKTYKKALVRPMKKDFSLLALNAIGFDVGYDAHIRFNVKAHTVIWSVSENNHAVDHAHEHPISIKFFKLLNEIKWVRGTGGEILYTDEHQRDSALQYAGGGGSTVNGRYGPKINQGAARR